MEYLGEMDCGPITEQQTWAQIGIKTEQTLAPARGMGMKRSSSWMSGIVNRLRANSADKLSSGASPPKVVAAAVKESRDV